MLIQLGLTELRPGEDWCIGVGSNGLRNLYVHPWTESRFSDWTAAYIACRAAARAFGFEFDQYGYVCNWYNVPGAASCQHFRVAPASQFVRRNHAQE